MSGKEFIRWTKLLGFIEFLRGMFFLLNLLLVGWLVYRAGEVIMELF